MLNQHKSEFFAAYVELIQGCNPREVIKELSHMGADSIFLNPQNYPNFDSNLLSNVYSQPVFFMAHASPNFFDFSYQVNKRNISIFFKMPERNVYGHTEVDFFYVPSSPLTHRFVKMALEVKRRLKSKMLLNPVIFTVSSKSADFVNNNCVSKGEFCAYPPDNKGSLTGRDVMLEALRQKCIFKTHADKFLAYLDKYFQSCVHKISNTCSQALMNKLDIDVSSVQSCFDHSFGKAESVQVDNVNEILEDDRKIRKNLGVEQFPEFYINEIKYGGSLDVFDLLMSICSTSVQEDSKECRDIDMAPELNESLSSIIIVNIFIFLVCLFFLALFIRNKMRQKFKKQVKKAIDTYMTEYSAINSDNNNLA